MSLTETCPTCILLYVEAVSQCCRWGRIVAQNQMDQWEQLICNFLSLFRNLKECLRVRFISQQKLNTELLSSFCPVHGASDRLLTLSGELKAVRVCVCFVDLTAFLGGWGDSTHLGCQIRYSQDLTSSFADDLILLVSSNSTIQPTLLYLQHWE